MVVLVIVTDQRSKCRYQTCGTLFCYDRFAHHQLATHKRCDCPAQYRFRVSPFIPGVTITVVEDGGNLDFTLNGGLGGLPALFFDFTNSKLSTLSVTGGPQTPQLQTHPLFVPNEDVELSFGAALLIRLAKVSS